jgi:hypothetical protein
MIKLVFLTVLKVNIRRYEPILRFTPLSLCLEANSQLVK